MWESSNSNFDVLYILLDIVLVLFLLINLEQVSSLVSVKRSHKVSFFLLLENMLKTSSQALQNSFASYEAPTIIWENVTTEYSHMYRCRVGVWCVFSTWSVLKNIYLHFSSCRVSRRWLLIGGSSQMNTSKKELSIYYAKSTGEKPLNTINNNTMNNHHKFFNQMKVYAGLILHYHLLNQTLIS